MNKFYAFGVACLLASFVPAPVAAQVLPPRANVVANLTTRLAWMQTTNTLAEAQALGYFLVVDGVTQPAVMDVVCIGVAKPYLCTSAFPSLTPGDHAIALIASFALAGGGRLDSVASLPPFLLRMVITPLAPSELRIIFGNTTSPSGK